MLPKTFAPGSALLAPQISTRVVLVFAGLMITGIASAADSSGIATLEALTEQNRLLKQQLDAQQKQIEDLRSRLDGLGQSAPQSSSDVAPTRSEGEGRKVVLSGFASAGLYAGQSKSRFPNNEFRVDEARLFLDAEIFKHAYFYGELILAQREAGDESFKTGELYLEVENLFGDGLADRLANLRVGRVGIPFGEEYQHRNPIDNPLVSHSVTDFWGVDEGVELFGESGKFSYALAVQNGSISRLRDGNRDKSIAGRLSWTPTAALHLSASAFRTGKLDATNDFLSELWIANNVFRSVGGAATRTFQADLYQFDARYDWNTGYLLGAIGAGQYRDDDPLSDNTRALNFFQIEGMQTLWKGLYIAGRFSRLEVDHGLFLSGLGNFGRYFLGTELTKRIERFGIGTGYRFSPNFNAKLEYTFENARLRSGVDRSGEDQLAAEVAVKF